MKNLILSLALMFALPALAAVTPGQPAPEFSVKDATGKDVKLADYKGKWVVLEWYNKDCPFVKKHYGSGNMQKLQKLYTERGVTWLTVISSKEGKQGYLEPAKALIQAKAEKASPTAILIDSTGTVGKAFNAKVTPHMFVIDPQGKIVYNGAIDDNDSADPDVIPKSKNYVTSALDAAMAGKKVEVTTTQPYGCGVKY